MGGRQILSQHLLLTGVELFPHITHTDRSPAPLRLQLHHAVCVSYLG